MKHYWLWNWRKETRSQGIWSASRSWKKHRHRFSPKVSRKEWNPANTLMLAHCFFFAFSCLAYAYAPCIQWVVIVENLKVLPSCLDLEQLWRTIQLQSTEWDHLRLQLLFCPVLPRLVPKKCSSWVRPPTNLLCANLCLRVLLRRIL